MNGRVVDNFNLIYIIYLNRDEENWIMRLNVFFINIKWLFLINKYDLVFFIWFLICICIFF